MRHGDFGGAHRWFAQIAGDGAAGDPLWPAVRSALRELCAAAQASDVAPPADESRLPALAIQTLGRFQVLRGGSALPSCRSRKAITILRYLLTCWRHSASAGELIEILWPEIDERHALHNLHVAVNMLRDYLDLGGPSYLITAGGGYALNPRADISYDGARFQQRVAAAERLLQSDRLLAAQEAFSSALALYHGDYVVDGHDYPWAVAERERLISVYLQALEHQGDLNVALGQPGQARQYYRQLIERDSYREDVHAKLMRCYLKEGRRSAAIRQYQQCKDILLRDLGIEPVAELRQLYQSIADGRAAACPPPAEAARVAELERLVGQLTLDLAAAKRGSRPPA